jgi:hypothetical protein
VENAEWMSAEVRREIEDLRRAHGFEEQEAIAFWHLSEARRAMMALVEANWERLEASRAERYDAEGIDALDLMGRKLGGAAHYVAMVEVRVVQHFEALVELLGKGVLRRDYPEGWGRAYREADEEQG